MPEPSQFSSSRVVTHGLCFVLGLVIAGGFGLAGIRQEVRRTAAERDRAEEAEAIANARLAEVEANLARAVKAEGEAKANLRRAEVNDRLARGQMKQAEANLKLARQAVDDAFGIAKDHPLMKGEKVSPELRQLKRELLEKALPFYQKLRDRKPGEK